MRTSSTCPILLVLALVASGCSPSSTEADTDTTAVPLAASAPPVARTVDVVDQAFGLELADPYRWMEGADNTEFRQWAVDQGAHARERLDALPTRKEWLERMTAVSHQHRVHRAFQRAGGRVFFIRQEGESTGALVVADASGGERLLLDPATLEGPGRAAIVDFKASPDGAKVAVAIDRDGSEISFVQVLDVTTGALSPTQLGPGLGGTEWLPDSSGFVYYQFADGEDRVEHDPYQSLRLRLYQIHAEDDSRDNLVLKAGSNATFGLQPSEFPGLVIPPGSNWYMAGASQTSPHLRLCVESLSAPLNVNTRWRCLADYADGVIDASIHGDTLLLVSNRDHPNRRVLAIDLADPDATLADARELLPESADAVVSRIVVGRDAYFVKRMRNGIDGIVRLPRDGAATTQIEMPFAGTIGAFSADPAHDGLFYSLQGWTQPTTVFAYHPGTGISTDLRLGSTSPIDVADITSLQIEATSADGTRVPVTIIHRRDLVLDGHGRAIVEAYGGYGYSIQPSFDPIGLQWVKAGHVSAFAHVRGGGEKGEAWRLGGHGANKHKGVEDLLASIDALIDRGYTARDRIGISGRSAAGLVIGGAMAKAPEQFAAAIIGVAWLNPVRVLEGAGGEAHVQESADPRSAEGLHVLAAMDPYLNLRPDRRYPPALLTVGLNDPRVPGWEAGKFTARLQTLSERPVWLAVQTDTGHFAATLDVQARNMADEFAFFDAAFSRTE